MGAANATPTGHGVISRPVARGAVSDTLNLERQRYQSRRLRHE